jgi:uncharacterized protein (TIGR00297 family)
MHETHEPLRKALHIAVGLFAVTLKWLPWPVAALCAVCAVLGNWLVLHRVFGARVARHERGYDAGIVLYPAMVLLLIIVFRHRIEIAGSVWAILAFGDGFATLAGRAIGGARLPWNREKTWSGFAAFIAFGFVGAEVMYVWLQTGRTLLSPMVIVGVTVVACAIAESSPLNVNDNVVVPLVGGGVMAILVGASVIPLPMVDRLMVSWLVANTLLAFAGWAARTVDFSGFLGGWAMGAVILLFGGWQLYAVLLAFFVIGTGVTKFGFRRKAGLGLAQEKGGRRGFAHAFSNVGMAALLAIASAMIPDWRTALWLAAAAALTTASADTTASEIGQLIGRRTFLPLTFRPVPVGTEGAISLEGTLAGIAAAVVVAIVASETQLARIEPRIAGFLVIAAFAGSYVESVAGSWNRKQARSVPNGVLNFFNTAVGAMVMVLLVRGSE